MNGQAGDVTMFGWWKRCKGGNDISNLLCSAVTHSNRMISSSASVDHLKTNLQWHVAVVYIYVQEHENQWEWFQFCAWFLWWQIVWMSEILHIWQKHDEMFPVQGTKTNTMAECCQTDHPTDDMCTTELTWYTAGQLQSMPRRNRCKDRQGEAIDHTVHAQASFLVRKSNLLGGC